MRAGFNSRSPSGERPPPTDSPQIETQFQLTLPEWGATSYFGTLGRKQPFQLTLPEWGATRYLPLFARYVTRFNSRSPSGERPVNYIKHELDRIVSTHAPRVGSDRPFQNTYAVICVSTHAPRVGSDILCRCQYKQGGRFQLTLPEWGATMDTSSSSSGGSVSTHAPRVGSDSSGTYSSSPDSVSTHAPRVGSDLI